MSFLPDFYNKAWSKWDLMKVYGPTARHTRRFVFALAEGLPLRSVLDAGCGSGILLAEFLAKYPSIKIYGSEYSAEGLAFARERMEKAEFRELDLGKESWGKKFDLVTCIDVVEHIPDDRAALQNLHQMTGKYLILSVPLGPLFRVEEKRMGHVHGYSRREIETKLKDAGFELIKAIQWGFPFYNIHRRIVNRLPEQTSMGEFGARKKILAKILYVLFFLNLRFWGERYYVLCRPSGAAK